MSKRFEALVQYGGGKSIRPIITADTQGEALKIAKAQYPDAKNIHVHPALLKSVWDADASHLCLPVESNYKGTTAL